MVDKALFLGTSGAQSSMQELQVITNNLANVSTTGFREDFDSRRQLAVGNNVHQQTRVYSQLQKTYASFAPGPIVNTGRNLDVAISGEGFFAVQSKSGQEGYTRAGDFKITNGTLTTLRGEVVKGLSGLITFPEDAERVFIGSDGTVSMNIKGNNQPVLLNRIKTVNPPISQMQKGADGLFYTEDGTAPPPDEKVKLTIGALEGSNVNPVETLTDLIELSRQFQMHTDLMKNVAETATKANQVLELPK